ncbi:MAG: hypothetical protein NWT08_09710 [Akkermansiaceae bacterium]|nr:hypothetical protein [Akkermansiaceae bacterium]
MIIGLLFYREGWRKMGGEEEELDRWGKKLFLGIFSFSSLISFPPFREKA